MKHSFIKYLVLFGTIFLVTLKANSQSPLYRVINDTGGLDNNLDDGIRAAVYENGAIEFYVGGWKQSSKNVSVANMPASIGSGVGPYTSYIKEETDGARFTNGARLNVCNSSFTGDGTVTSPWEVTQLGFSDIGGKRLYIQRTVTYVAPSVGYIYEYKFTPDVDDATWFTEGADNTTKDLNFYITSDVYLGNGNKGVGFARTAFDDTTNMDANTKTEAVLAGIYRSQNPVVPNCSALPSGGGTTINEIAHALVAPKDKPFTTVYTGSFFEVPAPGHPDNTENANVPTRGDLVTSNNYICNERVWITSHYKLGKFKKGETKSYTFAIAYATGSNVAEGFNGLYPEGFDLRNAFTKLGKSLVTPDPNSISSKVIVSFKNSIEAGKEGNFNGVSTGITLNVQGGILEEDVYVSFANTTATSGIAGTKAVLDTDFEMPNTVILIPKGDYTAAEGKDVLVNTSSLFLKGNTLKGVDRTFELTLEAPCFTSLVGIAATKNKLQFTIQDDDGVTVSIKPEISSSIEGGDNASFRLVDSSAPVTTTDTDIELKMAFLPNVDSPYLGSKPADVKVLIGGVEAVTTIVNNELFFTATIPAGTKQSGLIEIEAVEDLNLEGREQVVVAVANLPAGVTTSTNSKDFNVTLDDTDAPVNLNLVSVGNATNTIKENTTPNITFSLELKNDAGDLITNETGEDISIDVGYSAYLPSEFTVSTLPNQFTLQKETTKVEFTLTLADNTFWEEIKELEVAAVNTSNFGITIDPAFSQQVLVIEDDDLAVVSVSNLVATAKESDQSSAEISISFTNFTPVSEDITFTTIWAGTASFSDYEEIRINGVPYVGADFPTEITLKASDSEIKLTLKPKKDLLLEPNEDLTLRVTGVNTPAKFQNAFNGLPLAIATTIESSSLTANIALKEVSITNGEEKLASEAPSPIVFSFDLVNELNQEIINATLAPIVAKIAIIGTGNTAFLNDITLPTNILINEGSSRLEGEISIIDDTFLEKDLETLTFELSILAADNVGVIAKDATVEFSVTIQDNENPELLVDQMVNGQEGTPGVNLKTSWLLSDGVTNETGGPITIGINRDLMSSSFADFDNVSFQSVVIAEGEGVTSAIEASIVDDNLVEGVEELTFTPASITGTDKITIPVSSKVTLQVFDNDSNEVSVNGVGASELALNSGKVSFTVSLNDINTTADDVVIGISFPTSEATQADFITDLSTLTEVRIPKGKLSAVIELVVKDDALFEKSTEDFTLSIDTIDGVALPVPLTSTVLISDNEQAALTLTATDGKEASPTTDKVAFTFKLDQINNTGVPIVINLITSGSATSSDVSEAIESMVEIPVGSDTAVLTYTPITDTFVEGEEELVVTVINVSDLRIQQGQIATASIEESSKYVFAITTTSATVTEGEDIDVTVTVTPAPLSNITLNVSRENSTATALDFSRYLNTISFSKGESSKTFTINTLDDVNLENTETLFFTIKASENVDYVASDISQEFEILDNELANKIPLFVETLSQGKEDGEQEIVIKISLAKGENQTGMPISFIPTYTFGSGFDPLVDLEGVLPTAVVIPDGANSVEIRIKPKKDTLFEGAESFVFALETANNPTLFGAVSANLQIEDLYTSSDLLEVGFEKIASGKEGGGAIKFKLVLFEKNTSGGAITRVTNATGKPILIDVASVFSTALEDDFVLPLFIEANIENGSDSSAELTVAIKDDDLLEGTEFLKFKINVKNSFIGFENADGLSEIITVEDNDDSEKTVVVAIRGAETGADVKEGEDIVFKVSLSKVNFLKRDIILIPTFYGSATEEDFGIVFPTELTIPIGSSSVEVRIPVLEDFLKEGNETLTLEIKVAENSVNYPVLILPSKKEVIIRNVGGSDRLFINDAITPNDDGINDVFKMNTTAANPIELYVYTPSGERVYYSKNYDSSWGGDVNGKLLPFGNYFYLAIDKKEGISRKGVLYIKTTL